MQRQREAGRFPRGRCQLTGLTGRFHTPVSRTVPMCQSQVRLQQRLVGSSSSTIVEPTLLALWGCASGTTRSSPTDRLLRLPRSGCPSVHVPVPGGSRRRSTPQPILGGDGNPQFSLRRVSVPYPAVQAESDAAIRMASTRLVSLLGGETAVLQADGRLG